MAINLPVGHVQRSARAAFSQRPLLQSIPPSTQLICTRLQLVTLHASGVRTYVTPKADDSKVEAASRKAAPSASPFTGDYLRGKGKPKLPRASANESKNQDAKTQDAKQADVKKQDAKKTVPPPESPVNRNQMPEQGKLAPSSLFADEPLPELRTSETDFADPDLDSFKQDPRNPEALAATLIPKPWARARWQRKKVIQSIRKRGRLNKAQTLLRTERSSLSKSHFLKTSVKKLGPLARQIAGKKIDDAILQMRFSKKKAAKEVLTHLEIARDRAIVTRGMGLGDKIPEHLRPADEVKKDNSPAEAFPKQIKLKNGRRHEIESPFDMYVSQAWVGRGPYGKEPEYRAMGRLNILRPPYTSISVLLKEEKTRLREAKERDERDEKKRREKMWVQLPDKSIPGQRQYYGW